MTSRSSSSYSPSAGNQIDYQLDIICGMLYIGMCGRFSSNVLDPSFLCDSLDAHFMLRYWLLG